MPDSNVQRVAGAGTSQGGMRNLPCKHRPSLASPSVFPVCGWMTSQRGCEEEARWNMCGELLVAMLSEGH